MTTRRTARQVTPETDIVDNTPTTDNTDNTVVVDTATVEAPKTDIAPITLESLRAAQLAQKAQFRPLPNKGDLVAEIFENGQIGNTAIVATKPDTGAQFVQITWDRSGLSQLYPVAKIEKFGDAEWIARI